MIKNDNTKLAISKLGIEFFEPNARLLEEHSKTGVYTKKQMIYIHKRAIMPMTVMASPILTLLEHDNKHQYKPLYTNSFNSIYSMLQIIVCYTMKDSEIDFYLENKVLCDKIRNFMFSETDRLEQQLGENIYKLNNAKTFRTLIIQNTYDYIHVLEECLYELFLRNSKHDITKAECMTTITNEKDLNSSDKTFRLYFNVKNDNTRAEYGPECTTQFFNLDKEIYQQYLNYYQIN